MIEPPTANKTRYSQYKVAGGENAPIMGYIPRVLLEWMREYA